MKFTCDKCGLCCKAINCQYLKEDNTCSIYETRPVICDVEKTYNLYLKDKMSKVQWFKINEDACKTLKAQEK